MRWSRVFGIREHGIVVVPREGEVVVLEYNELLGRIANGGVQADDIVLGAVFTDGRRRRAGDLRVFGLVRSGQVRTDDLPRRAPGGVLAHGETARRHLRDMEGHHPHVEAATLLRAVTVPALEILSVEMLRAATAVLSTEPPDQLPRPTHPQDKA